MTPDDYLERLLDAVEKNNYWDVQAYSQKILGELHKVKSEFRNELKSYIESLMKEAEKRYAKERNKQDLINTITSGQTERIKLK